MSAVLLAGFLLLAALAVIRYGYPLLSGHIRRSPFRVGLPVVYRREEVSTHPSADARNVRPSERGEDYYYSTVAYLRVTEVLRDGRIIAVARNQERLCVWPTDSNLRKAHLAERLIYRPRFPTPSLT